VVCKLAAFGYCPPLVALQVTGDAYPLADSRFWVVGRHFRYSGRFRDERSNARKIMKPPTAVTTTNQPASSTRVIFPGSVASDHFPMNGPIMNVGAMAKRNNFASFLLDRRSPPNRSLIVLPWNWRVRNLSSRLAQRAMMLRIFINDLPIEERQSGAEAVCNGVVSGKSAFGRNCR
jgi:hypothetical protein